MHLAVFSFDRKHGRHIEYETLEPRLSRATFCPEWGRVVRGASCPDTVKAYAVYMLYAVGRYMYPICETIDHITAFAVFNVIHF